MAKLYWGRYGHGNNPNAKEYVYWGSDNYRTHQNVNVPVTHWKSGKTYNTMFTITHSSESQKAIDESQRVMFDIGKGIKTINGSDVMDLPGAADFSSKKQWAEWSQMEYTLGQYDLRDRLGDFATQSTEEARARLMEGSNG